MGLGIPLKLPARGPSGSPHVDSSILERSTDQQQRLGDMVLEKALPRCDQQAQGVKRKGDFQPWPIRGPDGGHNVEKLSIRGR